MQNKISEAYKNLIESGTAKLVIANSLWILAEKVIRALLGLLVGAWVARYLGPQDFGELAYAVSFIAFFQAIVGLGADGVVVREISINKSKAGEILGTVFCLRFTAGLTCWLLALLDVVLENGFNDSLVSLVFFVGLTLVFQPADTIDLWFQSQSQSRRAVYAKLVTQLVSNAIKVALILASMPLLAFAVVTALEGLITAIGLIVAYKSFKTDEGWIFLKQTGFKLLKESWPYVMSSLSVAIYMRIDQVMIRNMLGATQLGIYAVAVPLSQVWFVLPMSLATSLAPYLARKKTLGEEAYYAFLLKIFRFFGLTAVLISLFMYAGSDYIVKFLYGDAYKDASLILGIHVFSCVFVFQGLAQSLWIVNEGKGIMQTYQTLMGAFTALTLNYVLIPIYGINGAAITAVLSYAMAGVFSNIFLAPKIFRMQFGLAI